MAYVKEETTEIPYFKPQYKFEYRPSKGLFVGWDYETKQQLEMKELKFVSIINLHRYESQDGKSPFDFTSNILKNLFADKIHITEIIRKEDKPAQYKKRGIIKWNGTSNAFCHLDTETDAVLQGQSTLTICGMLESGESILITIKGTVKLDLLKVASDSSNAKKVEDFKEGTFLTLKPVAKAIKVGKAPKTKNVFLLNVIREDDTNELDPEQEERLKGILAAVNADWNYHQGYKAKEEDLSEVLVDEDEQLTDEEIPF